jgi:RHS repeat-associated protein
MLTDPSGHPAATYDYSDYGETRQTSGSAALYNPFLYTGQEYDFETSLYHLRARHYSPARGRFFARDPIGYAGGSNMYAYCAGDPVNRIDPSGTIAFFAVIDDIYQEPFSGSVFVEITAHWITAFPGTWFTNPFISVLVTKFTPSGWQRVTSFRWDQKNAGLSPILATVGYKKLPTLVIAPCSFAGAAILRFEFSAGAVNQRGEQQYDDLNWAIPVE